MGLGLLAHDDLLSPVEVDGEDGDDVAPVCVESGRLPSHLGQLFDFLSRAILFDVLPDIRILDDSGFVDAERNVLTLDAAVVVEHHAGADERAVAADQLVEHRLDALLDGAGGHLFLLEAVDIAGGGR